MHKALAPLVVGAFLVAAAAPASAAGPAGGCPASYTLTVISDLPAPAQPGATAIDQRGNDDGYICLLAFRRPVLGNPYNAIDNRVQAP